MIIERCPCCGRIPKILECVSFKKNCRKRMIYCPNNCSVLKIIPPITNEARGKSWYFIHFGNEDDNTLYKEWNKRIIKVV
jgi:hypothetical protein